MTYDSERQAIDAWYAEQIRLLHEPQLTWLSRKIDAAFDAIASVPPFSWLDRALRGPVGRDL